MSLGGSTWVVRDRIVRVDRPVIMGVLNVTPDSFSDGGQFADPIAAADWAEAMLEEGADIVDIGGESTRPGAQRVSEEEELGRVLSALREIRRRCGSALISIDTTRATVARAALEEGAQIVNDVSGLRWEPPVAELVARYGAGLVVMHSRGSLETMASYERATYGSDVVGEVMAELGRSLAVALAAGVPREAIVVDPGVGFSKRSEHSLAVLRGIPRLAQLGFPILVGASRKRLVGDLTGVAEPKGRLYGTLGVHLAALTLGARLFRVHDVAAHRQALDSAFAVLGER
jgi:dihydropteroate synthase